MTRIAATIAAVLVCLGGYWTTGAEWERGMELFWLYVLCVYCGGAVLFYPGWNK